MKYFAALLLSLLSCWVAFGQLIPGNPFFVAGVLKPAVGGGPDVWYETTATTDANTTIGAAFMEWDAVTLSVGGTVTKLRARVQDSASSVTLKIALYSSGGSLLCDGSVVVPDTASDEWFEVTVGTPAVVSSGTHYIAISASAGVIRIKSLNGAGFGNYATQLHATFPPASLPTADGTLETKFRLAAYVD